MLEATLWRIRRHLRVCAAICGLGLTFVAGPAQANESYSSWANTSGSTGYVSGYYPGLAPCLGAIGRHDSWEAWVGANYACRGVYAKSGGGSAYLGISRCVKETSSTGYCTWTDFGGQSGHEGNANGLRSTGTCAAGYHWTGESVCVLGTGDGSNYGCRDCEKAGNPIHARTGNKYQREVDYSGRGPFPLEFVRTYNSFVGFNRGSIGPDWRSNYDRRLKVRPYGSFGSAPYQWIASAVNITATRADGQELTFTATVDASTNYQLPDGFILSAQPYVTERLEKTATGFRLHTAQDGVEDYNASGRLLSLTDRHGRTQQLQYDANGRLSIVQDAFGKQLVLTHNAQGRLATMTDPAGEVYQYAYNATGRLTTVTNPDTTIRTYHYEHPTIPHLLYGITDENGQRFAEFRYDASQARSDLSEHAGSADRVTLVYNADGTTSVTDALGTTRVRSFADTFGLFRNAGVSAACASCGDNPKAISYDANGFVSSRTDFNDNVTTYVHNARGLAESRTEAYGTSLARTITTQWHATFRLPTQIDEPGRRTTYTYDSATGDRLTQTVADLATGESRTTTWTYTTLGRVETIDGPRIDVADITTYGHYECATGSECGQVHTITNALGHVTEITSYDAHGNPLTIVDPNGVTTTLTYDLRQRLTSRIVGGAETSFDYDGVGQLDKVTLPDGSYLDYTYDAAHRLTDIQDNLGNRIHYTLDRLGNRTKEEVFDPSNTLKRVQSQVFDTLGRLDQIKNAAGQVVTDFGYDAQGNRTSQLDYSDATTGFTTGYTPDALNRIERVTDAASGVTEYRYNALDQLDLVTDPKNLATSYTLNALGDLKQQVSPDTGTTSYTYDAAGNRETQLDARGIGATYSYDALNRLSFIDYPGSVEDVTYFYDGENYEGALANGVGRLTGIEDQSGSTLLIYDPHGNVTDEVRVVGAATYRTSYTYDLAGRLTGMTYPTSRTVALEHNAGQVSRVTTSFGGVTTTLADGVAYMPFGAIKSYVLGNGITVTRTPDLDYRVDTLVDQGSSVVQSLDLTYDLRNNITGIADLAVPGRTQSVAYDDLSRLASASGAYGQHVLTYDTVGNRLTEALTPDGGPTASSTYSYATGTHRLAEIAGASVTSFSYDNAGNTTNKGGLGLGYNAAGRAYQVGGVSNVYNAAGQRMTRTADGKTVVFIYDLAGHLIVELEDGEHPREYVWLDNEPLSLVAARKPEAAEPGPLDGVVPAAGPYESDAQTVALYHFDTESVTPPLLTRTTPDSGPYELNGSLEGAVLPTHVPATAGGYGWAYKFDGVDRGADNSRINMGTDQRLGFRGASAWTLDVLVTATAGPADDGYYRGIVCRAGPAGVDYSLSYLSWTDPTDGPQHEFWFTTGVPAEFPTGYSYAAVQYAGHMEVGESYAVRVTVQGGVMAIAVNGIPGTSTYWPTQPGVVSPVAQPMAGQFTVGKDCPEDSVVKPSELQIDELRISSTARTDVLTGISASPEPPQPEVFYFHNNHLGAPQKLTDSQQGIAWGARYEPFGEATVLTENVVQPLRFPGQYFDAETGLHQNWHRDYDPSIGRYLQSDPIGLDGGPNTYAYANLNPTRFIDVQGLKAYFFKVVVGGGVSVPGIGGQVFNLAVTDPIKGETCNYTVSCLGPGWSYRGTPSFGGGAGSVRWDDGKECSNCKQFEGTGMAGQIGFQLGPIGYTPVDWLEVPNGPRLDFSGWSPATFNVGGGTFHCRFSL